MKFREGQKVLVDITLNGQTKTEQATVYKQYGSSVVLLIGGRKVHCFASQIRREGKR